MKKFSYISGMASVFLVLLGVNFKIQHWPGAGIMITLGIFCLVFVFLPVALVNSYKNVGNRKNLALYVVSYLTILVVMLGALFKIQHWPGAGYLIVLGLPFPFLIFLPVYLFVTSRMEQFELNKTVFVLLALACISVFSALLAINVSKDLLDDTLSLAAVHEKMNSSLGASVNARNDLPEGVKSSAAKLLAQIGRCKELMARATHTPAEELKQQGVQSIGLRDAQNIAVEALMGGQGISPANQLKEDMDKFKASLAAAGSPAALQSLANTLLNTSGRDAQGEEPGWDVLTFGGRHVTWVMNYLEGLENSVYMLEMAR